MQVVNSHNHWDTLEEVIVGVPYHINYDLDSSFRFFFFENLIGSEEGVFFGEFSQRMYEEIQEDLEGFIRVLEQEGIVVKRPERFDEVKTIETPFFKAPMGHAMMSRDLFIVIGNEIIETSPMVRARYFESEYYKELFTEYFNQGAKWTSVPKSRLKDENYDYSFVKRLGWKREIPENLFFEIMFDGPQIIRCGYDLFFNASTENHRMGATWLQRHLGAEYKVHVFDVGDSHVDGRIVPLKPGVLLLNRRVKKEWLPEELQKWEIIDYTPLSMKEDNSGLPYLASESIGMNVLSLDQSKIIVQNIQIDLIKDLERRGFEPIPVRWRYGRTLGGGFHCMTLDVRRQSKLEKYF